MPIPTSEYVYEHQVEETKKHLVDIVHTARSTHLVDDDEIANAILRALKTSGYNDVIVVVTLLACSAHVIDRSVKFKGPHGGLVSDVLQVVAQEILQLTNESIAPQKSNVHNTIAARENSMSANTTNTAENQNNNSVNIERVANECEQALRQQFEKQGMDALDQDMFCAELGATVREVWELGREAGLAEARALAK